jgi:hypothetical protein
MSAGDNVVRLIGIERTADTVRFPFEAGAAVAPYLWRERQLTIHCSEGVHVDPAHLRAVFLLAMAPLHWMCGTEIALGGEVDASAVGSLRALGDHLQRFYGWERRDLTAGQSTRPVRRYRPAHRALLFSAGVDSMMSLVEEQDRLDWLVHVSNFENLDCRTSEGQREEALRHTREIAHASGLGWLHLRTNIPAVLRHARFDAYFPGECSFWLGLEHVHHLATALAALRVPFAEVLMSGGFNDLLHRTGSCAADADFIAHYTWPQPLRLLHEKMLRQDKVEKLLRQAPQRLKQLRVCFSSGDGVCPDCRKCQATLLMVLTAGGSLTDTNFPAEILPSLERKLQQVVVEPPEQHTFFNEALLGSALAGSRAERWEQVGAIVRREQARFSQIGA